MPYINFSEMLKKARQQGYAVGAFNILDFNSMKAVIDGAQELESPVIVQTSSKTVKFWGFRTLVKWIKHLSENITVPVAMHLDHCGDIKFIKRCIDSGWSSVMIDASALPFEENKKLSKTVLELAHSKGVSVEAELGEIGGVEDDLVVSDEDAHLADPEKAIEFCKEIPVDCFAPAIGTAHGIYKGKPKVAFSTLENISQRTPIPLALHGGTGLSDEVFDKCISLGCAKVNISTQLKYAFINSFIDYHQANDKAYDPLKVLDAQYKQLKTEVKENLSRFGSSGKA